MLQIYVLNLDCANSVPIKISLLHSKLTVKPSQRWHSFDFYVVAKVILISESSIKYFRFQQFINIEHKKPPVGGRPVSQALLCCKAVAARKMPPTTVAPSSSR